ncbi:MAG: response regulator [Trueperaceae bacterium]|nr:response regulator [Trueperaceae bacterium]
METKARILIAEDHVPTRRLLRNILSRAGHEVVCTVNGEGIVATVTSFRPHLVLLDVRMPKVDGFGAARALLGLPADERPLIVLITAFSETWEGLEPLLTHVDGIIPKPFSHASLTAWVDKSLSAPPRPPSG